MKKKLVALVLVASMAATALIGCGEKDNTPASSGTTEKSEESSQTSGSEETPVEDDGIFNATGFPIVDEPITLTIMGSADTARGTSWAENKAWAYISELTGVQFEFIEVASGEYAEELSLTLASGELPDIILSGLGTQELVENIKVGNVIDQTPYIEAYGENIKALMESLEGYKQGITLPTGEIAGLAYLNMMTDTGKCPQSLFYFYGPWMEKLNLEVPKTADELYDVLVAFKTQDPNGNGQADEIPFLPRNTNNMYELWSMFGVVVQKGNYAYALGDEIVFSPFMDGFKEGLKYITKLYQEGLINPDVFTDGNSQSLAKGSGEVEIAGSTISAAAFAVVGEERNEDMVLAPYIAADGYEMAWLNRTVVNNNRWVITKDCEYPEVAVRIADYFASDEGAKLFWMGTEENYTYGEDGTWTWNLAEGQTVEQIRAVGTLQTSCIVPAAFTQEWFLQDAGAETKANEDRVIMGTEYADYLRLIVPALVYDADVQEERTILAADINGYVDNAIAQFITGELDVDKDWDAFVKQCEKLGVEEYIQMTQDAYDVYLGK